LYDGIRRWRASPSNRQLVVTEYGVADIGVLTDAERSEARSPRIPIFECSAPDAAELSS
jgi:acyl-CoA hydrolase